MAIAVAGCGRVAEFASRRADKAAYGIIGQKQEAALGEAQEFTIEPQTDGATARVEAEAPRLDLAQDMPTTPTMLISLGEALALALENNREYQARKESLYAQALGLTLTRRDYGPIFDAAGSGQVSRVENAGVIERFGSYGFTVGVQQFLATGARVAVEYSHDFSRFFSGPARPQAQNALTLSLVQPLLRGAGPLVALEPLRQDERDMIFAVRDFKRYQTVFVIEVAVNFYGLLSAQDQLHNAASNLEGARTNWRRLERFADGGRVSDIEVDQGRQELLRAQDEVYRAQISYGRQLDQFKLFLGVPTDLDLGPDPRELEAIAARGLVRPALTLAEAERIAVAERLDLINATEQVEDSRRRVEIARRDFLPGLDASVNYTMQHADEKNSLELDPGNTRRNFGLSLILPTDWTPRRNNYRLAQVAQRQAERRLELARESLILEVRDAWRQLEQLRSIHRIQLESVQLAERRVRGATLRLQMGRADARDLLEAQEALLQSRNALTSALVNYTIQRLRFWNAIERLEIDPKGMWYEDQITVPVE